MQARVELYYKTRQQLADLGRCFATKHSSASSSSVGKTTKLLPSVMFTNKSAEDQVVEDAKFLINQTKKDPSSASAASSPSFDISAVFSLKAMWSASSSGGGGGGRSVSQQNAKKDAVWQQWRQFYTGAQAAGVPRVLIVSGYPKKPLDSVELLQREAALRKAATGTAANNNQSTEKKNPPSPPPRIGVAFTAYYPDEAAREEERLRLLAKLESGVVGDIWLQFGGDPQRLREELDWLRKVLDSSNGSSGSATTRGRRVVNSADIEVHGSMFVPSAQWLSRFRFRPWTGIFLPPGFLDSLESAEAGCAAIMEVYREHGVQVLIESATYNDKDWQRNLDFLARCGGVTNLGQKFLNPMSSLMQSPAVVSEAAQRGGSVSSDDPIITSTTTAAAADAVGFSPQVTTTVVNSKAKRPNKKKRRLQ